MSIDRFCTLHLGKCLTMINGRSRAVNRLNPLYRVPSSGKVTFRDNSDMCISAAFCNSLLLLGSSTLALKY